MHDTAILRTVGDIRKSDPDRAKGLEGLPGEMVVPIILKQSRGQDGLNELDRQSEAVLDVPADN